MSAVISWIANARFVQNTLGICSEVVNNATAAAGHEMSGSQFPRPVE